MMSPAHRADFVAYYRVSTDRQGESGLGLEAQRKAIADFLNGGAWNLIGEFTEVESGKRSDNRPQLAAALDLCRRKRATLVIAKLDRLSRNVAFIATLLDSNVKVKCADMPEADRTMLQMLAVFAEHERRMISQRTKAALQAARARGVKLGGPNKRQMRAASKLGAARNRQLADEYASRMLPMLRELMNGGSSMSAAARLLNQRGIKTRKGCEWSAAQISNVLRRAAT